MTRYRTTKEWADRFACGRVYSGTLLRVLDPEELGYWQDRTKTYLIRLDKPIGDWRELRFDPKHVEIIERVATTLYADEITAAVLTELCRSEGFDAWWGALENTVRDEIENAVAARIDHVVGRGR